KRMKTMKHHGSVFADLHCAERDTPVKIGEFLSFKKDTIGVSRHSMSKRIAKIKEQKASA
ncbi:MAG: hypothetical protein JSW72_00115, partial [Candidatus Bathyarchaeota archaeon]